MLARAWLPRLAVLLIVTGVALFLRWSLQREWIGPLARVALSMLAGAGMLVWGMRLKGRKFDIIGQGLLGGGLLVLYFSAYAAGPKYHVVESLTAVFGLMLAVTLTGGLLAVRSDSLLIAILGLAGGYLTPVLLRTPTPNLPGFYSYLLLLSLGVLGVAQRKEWRLLNYLAFVFTYALFYGSLSVYDRRADFVLALSFLTAYFLVHSWIVYAHTLLRNRLATVLDVGHLAANAALYGWGGYWLIRQAHGRPWPALLTLGLAVFFLAQALVFLRQRRTDRSLLVTLLALCGAYSALTLPLMLEKETLTICLALLAFMFLWIGHRIGSNFLQNLAYALYGIVFYRLTFLDLPRNFGGRLSAPPSWAEYGRRLLDRLATFGICLAATAAAFWLQQRQPSRPPALARENDTPLLPRALTNGVFYWFGLLFAFLFLQFEIHAMLALYRPLRLPLLTALWCAMAAYFLWRGAREGFRNPAAVVAMCVFAAGAAVKLFSVDLAAWEFDEGLIYRVRYGGLDAAMRLLDFGALLLFCGGAWRVLSRRPDRAAAPVFGYAGLALLFVYATLELNSLLYWKLPPFQNGGLSLLWALFAVAFVAGGIRREVRALRYLGLALFLVVVGKVFLLDLDQMSAIYRVAASLGVGLILLASAFAYLAAARKFHRAAAAAPAGPPPPPAPPAPAAPTAPRKPPEEP